MKPALDLFQITSVDTISFLSGCTVLSMSCYSVGRGLIAHEKAIDFKTGTPLALGSAIGGILGKQLFNVIKKTVENSNIVGGVQAICLAIIMVCTLVYMLNKKRIKTYRLHGVIPCAIIEITLGVLSSFLGIGGGPVNLVMLYYFFSMPTKAAAQNSLYIISVSQLASIATTIMTRSIPSFEWSWLVLMIAGGIIGGTIGRKINGQIQDKQVGRLFTGLMFVIIGINCYNIWHFFM